MQIIFSTEDFKKANSADMSIMSNLILSLAQREEPESSVATTSPELPKPIEKQEEIAKTDEAPTAEEQDETTKVETVEKPKRHRRTKAEMQAAREAEKAEKEAAAKAETVEKPAVEPAKEKETQPEIATPAETEKVESAKEEVKKEAPAKAETVEKPAVEPAKEEAPEKEEITAEHVRELGKNLAKKGLGKTIGKLMVSKYQVKHFSKLPENKLADVYADFKKIEAENE